MELGFPGGEEREGDHLGLCSINDSQGPKRVITGYCRTARPQATGSLLSTLKPPNLAICLASSFLGVCKASSGENTHEIIILLTLSGFLAHRYLIEIS